MSVFTSLGVFGATLTPNRQPSGGGTHGVCLDSSTGWPAIIYPVPQLALAPKYVASHPPRFRSVPLVGSPAHCGFCVATYCFNGAQALCDRTHVRSSALPQQLRLVFQGSCGRTSVRRSALLVQSYIGIHVHRHHTCGTTRGATTDGCHNRCGSSSPCILVWAPSVLFTCVLQPAIGFGLLLSCITGYPRPWHLIV